MKRVTFWLLMAGLTFILGAAAAALLYFRDFDSNIQKSDALPEIENVRPEMPDLTFCELVENPEKYDRKIVRLSAKMSIGLENSWFFDSRCGADNVAIISSKNKDIWKVIDEARAGKGKEPWASRLDLQVKGKFENTPFTGCCTKAPFQFEIMSVEKASKPD